MKRHLALITAVGMVSSFSLSNAVDATGEFLEGPNSVRVVYVSKREKKKKSGFGLISRLVKSAIYNGALIAGAMHVTDKIGYTDQNNIKGKFNNLVDVFKKSSGVEDFARNLMSNPDAVNTLNTACYTIPAGITLGSIAGVVGSLVLGVSNIGALSGIALGSLAALGATGKTFMSTAIIPVGSKVAGMIPVSGGSSNT